MQITKNNFQQIIRAVLKIPPNYESDKSFDYFQNMDRIISSTPEIAYRQVYVKK